MEFRTEVESSASTFSDITDDGKDELIIAGTKGEIIILDSKGPTLSDLIYRIGYLK